MAVAGTSDMMVDTRQVPTMKTVNTRRLSVPAFDSSHKAKRRSRPELMKACAMMNIARTKKNTGLMKVLKAVPRSATSKMGRSTTARSDVTATGTASLTHRMSTTAKMAAMRCPSAGSASGPGPTSRRRAASDAPARPHTAGVMGRMDEGDAMSHVTIAALAARRKCRI